MSGQRRNFKKDRQFYKFCFYGFLKNLRLFEPFLILFFLENKLSFLQIGFLYSLREISRNLLEIPAGILADSLGRKKTMISSFLFYILSFFSFYFSESYGAFILSMVLYSLGDAFRTGTHKAMIFDYLKINGWEDEKVYYYGHTRSYSQLGSAVSALIAGFFVFFTDSFRLIFIFSAIPYILDLILISTYPKELDGEVARFEKGKILSIFKKVLIDFLFSFKELRILKSISNLSMFTGYFQSLKDYLQPVLQALALSLPVLVILEDKQRISVIFGVVYFFIYLLTSYSSRHAGSYSKRFKNLRIPLNSTLITGLLIGGLSGLFYETNIIWVSVIFFIGIYIIENLRKPIGIAFVTETVDNRILATVLSAESQAHTLVAALLAPLIGYLADVYGLGYAILSISGLLILLSPLYLLGKKKMKKKNQT